MYRAHYISFDHTGLDAICPHPAHGAQKRLPEEGMPKLSWDKGTILRRGYSRARELQGTRFWPQRAVRPGWAELQPQAAESWASSGGSSRSQTFQSSMTHEPGKFCQARLFSLILDTLWKALRAAVLKGAGRGDRCHTPLVGASPSSCPSILSFSLLQEASQRALPPPGTCQPRSWEPRSPACGHTVRG